MAAGNEYGRQSPDIFSPGVVPTLHIKRVVVRNVDPCFALPFNYPDALRSIPILTPSPGAELLVMASLSSNESQFSPINSPNGSSTVSSAIEPSPLWSLLLSPELQSDSYESSIGDTASPASSTTMTVAPFSPTMTAFGDETIWLCWSLSFDTETDCPKWGWVPASSLDVVFEDVTQANPLMTEEALASLLNFPIVQSGDFEMVYSNEATYAPMSLEDSAGLTRTKNSNPSSPFSEFLSLPAVAELLAPVSAGDCFGNFVFTTPVQFDSNAIQSGSVESYFPPLLGPSYDPGIALFDAPMIDVSSIEGVDNVSPFLDTSVQNMGSLDSALAQLLVDSSSVYSTAGVSLPPTPVWKSDELHFGVPVPLSLSVSPDLPPIATPNTWVNPPVFTTYPIFGALTEANNEQAMPTIPVDHAAHISRQEGDTSATVDMRSSLSPSMEASIQLPSSIPHSARATTPTKVQEHRCLWRHPSPCNQIFPDAFALYRHLTENHIGRKQSTSNTHLKSQKETVVHDAHGGAWDGNVCLRCWWDDCTTIKKKRDHITSHLVVHVDLQYVCKHCNLQYKRLFDLRKHEKQHHGTEVSAQSYLRKQQAIRKAATGGNRGLS